MLSMFDNLCISRWGRGGGKETRASLGNEPRLWYIRSDLLGPAGGHLSVVRLANRSTLHHHGDREMKHKIQFRNFPTNHILVYVCVCTCTLSRTQQFTWWAGCRLSTHPAITPMMAVKSRSFFPVACIPCVCVPLYLPSLCKSTLSLSLFRKSTGYWGETTTTTTT